MIIQSLVPPNLRVLGVKRRTPDGIADLLTIRDTPYPVLTNYEKLCAECPLLKPYGGGSWIKQGARVPGYITSGYRDEALNGNDDSPHCYAFALDFITGAPPVQVEVAKVAIKYFSRIGFYPQKGIIHADLAPENWILKYNKARFWVFRDGKYFYYNDFEEAAQIATI